MLIFFIRKNKKGERNRSPKNDKDYHEEHNESMRRFRLSHPQELTIAKDMITADGNILAIMKRVKLTKHVQN